MGNREMGRLRNIDLLARSAGARDTCRAWLLAGIALPLMLAPSIASAQSPDQVDAAASADATETQDIIITGRKRAERLEDIPESVSVFTSADIQAAGIQSVADFADLTPGVYFSGDWSPSVSTFTIRGVSNNPNADAPVAFVVDGVVYGNSYLMGQDLFDIAQIEVLKGPQGTLYGRNSTGGAINIVTRRPTNDWSGHITATIGNGDLYKVRGGIYGPIVKDKIFFGFSGVAQKFDGLIMNEFLNKPVDFRKGGAGRARLLFTPTAELTADFTYTRMDYHSGSTYWRADNVPPALGLPTGIIQSDYLTEADLTVNDFSGKIDYATEIGTFTAIANHQKVTIPRTVDIDFLQRSLTEVLTSPDTAKSTTFELRFTSPDDRRFRWSVGGFYQDQDRIRAQNVYVNTNPNKDPALKTLVLAQRVPTDQPNQVRSVFGQAEFDITPQLELAAGLRYDEDRREDRIAGLKEKFTATSPKVTLSYKPGAHSLIYATYSEGFRSGGFNPTAVFGRVYQPEELRNYEVGFKTRALDGMLNLNGAIYYQDYSNQQFYVFSTAAASQALINAQKSRAKGIEVEARLRPMRGLELVAGVSVVDSKITQFGPFNAFAGLTEADINGNRLLFTPDHSINLTAQYGWKIGSLDATARTDFVRRGRIYWGFDNVENQAPVNLVDARLGIGGDAWTLTAYAENLFNKGYDTFCFVGRFIGNANRINPCASATPRQYGLEASFRF